MGNVLVVDDEPDSCRALMLLVRQLDYGAECVASGPDALRLLREHPAELVLLDWMMPDMNGRQVLEAIRSERRFDQVPVIVFTALSDPVVRREALAAGAQDLVVKGHFDEVIAAVRKYVGAARAERTV
jgi:CheY-like chemotaxis protein